MTDRAAERAVDGLSRKRRGNDDQVGAALEDSATASIDRNLTFSASKCSARRPEQRHDADNCRRCHGASGHLHHTDGTGDGGGIDNPGSLPEPEHGHQQQRG
jgi:hypothetical protein